MIYLYGLCAAARSGLDDHVAGLPGLEDPVQVKMIDEWGLIYSSHAQPEVLPKRRLMLRHTKVLENALEVGTLLPARFGLVAGSLQEACDLVQLQQVAIAAEFEKIAGCVEIGVRIRFPKDAAIAATLQSSMPLQAQHKALQQARNDDRFALAQFGGQLADAMDRRRGIAQRRIIEAVLPECRDHVLRAPDDDAEVLRAEFLIDHDNQEDFQNSVVNAIQSLDFAPEGEPNVQFIGPVPIYNFVNLNLTFDDNREAA